MGQIINGKPLADTNASKVESIAATPFGVVAFSRPNAAQVFERRGNKSTVAINGQLPIQCGPHRFTMDVALWGRLSVKGGDTQVTFEASLPQRFKADDDSSADAMLSHVENAAAAWNGYDAACAAAYERLTEVKLPKADGTISKDMRPRLVFKPKAAPQAPATA